MPREIGWRKLNSACVMTRALVPLGFDKSNIVTSFGAEIIKFQYSIKFQESRLKNNQDLDSRLKIQESREDSIKISTKKVFQNIE